MSRQYFNRYQLFLKDGGFRIVPGIELPIKGECGGMALCATCQVYVLSEHPLAEASDDELAMLDQAFFVKSNSRLGCQIHLNPNLQGLKVALAPEIE